MKRAAVIVIDGLSLEEVVMALDDGYIIDPELKVIRLDTSAIYHLIQYTEEELAEMEAVEEANGKFDGVTSIKSVPIAEADVLLEEGYVILDTYAKTVTLMKKEGK